MGSIGSYTALRLIDHLKDNAPLGSPHGRTGGQGEINSQMHKSFGMYRVYPQAERTADRRPCIHSVKFGSFIQAVCTCCRMPGATQYGRADRQQTKENQAKKV